MKKYNGLLEEFESKYALEDDLKTYLVESRNATNHENCIALLNKAYSLSKTIKNKTITSNSCKIEILTDLAKEVTFPSKKLFYWQQALDEGFIILENQQPVFVNYLAKKMVALLRDPYVALPKRELDTKIATIKSSVDNAINISTGNLKASLLSRKSSLLRRMASNQLTRSSQIQLTKKAIRCSQKAIEADSTSWDAYLSLALSYWQDSEFDKNERVYAEKLVLVEKNLWKSIDISPNIYNLLTIADYFKLTYQSLPFIESYERYLEFEYYQRRIYRNSYKYGEVVVRLWYSGFDETLLNEYLLQADKLLSSAINSGVVSSKIVVQLAFIKATLGNVDLGYDVIRLLNRKNDEDICWNRIATFVNNAISEEELVSRGFAIGISDATIWNKLGTFSIDFHKNLNVGIDIYRVALKIAPSNAIYMTNIARALLMLDNKDSLREAKHWISKAASCAPRRFKWWKKVRSLIDKKNSEANIKSLTFSKRIQKGYMQKLQDVYNYYLMLQNTNDVQARGYGLEKLVKKLFLLTVGNCDGSYRASLKHFKVNTLQIDASFYYLEKDYFRVETKWTKKKTTPDDIILFDAKLDAHGVKGLFISINGFSEEAIRKAHDLRKDKVILLMDGEELELALQASPSFDEILRQKQIAFCKNSNPYSKVANKFIKAA